MKKVFSYLLLFIVFYLSLDLIPYLIKHILSLLVNLRTDGGYSEFGFWGWSTEYLSYFVSGFFCVILPKQIFPVNYKHIYIVELVLGILIISVYLFYPIEKVIPLVLPFSKLLTWYLGLLPSIWLIVKKYENS